MNLPIYNIVLEDADGLTKMSLVESPAVDSNFIAFSKEEPMKFSLDDEQHIVFGCALRANYPIYRERNGQCFYIIFTKEVIKSLYEKFMRDGLTFSVNVEHDKDVQGCFLIQSFLKKKALGINPLGFDDVEDGSWFVGYKIENPEVWNEVKLGRFKGFSVEMFANLEKVEEVDEIDALLKEI